MSEAIERNCPASIRDCHQWVAWKYVERDGKPTKAPINPHTGLLASSTDSSTWGTFSQAMQACERNKSLAGVGFVFSADDPNCGVDLDDSIDEATRELKPWARQIVDRLDSYTEISPSGLGLKVFIRASKPGSRCRKAYHDGEVEIYDRDRFFTVTGNRIVSVPDEVNIRQESLDAVYAQVFGNDEPGANGTPSTSRGPQPSDSGSVSLSDDQIINLASRRRSSGAKFQSLWNGDWNSHFNSASEADSSVVFIPFRVDLRTVTKPIPDYHKLLISEEGPGILNWLLEGFKDWRKNGFIEPQSVISETRSYRGSSDELGRFIADCCEVSPELVVASSELFDAYRTWGGQQSQTRFSIAMQSRFNCETRTFGRHRNKRVFEGCALSKVEAEFGEKRDGTE